jgi:hypothetical protein
MQIRYQKSQFYWFQGQCKNLTANWMLEIRTGNWSKTQCKPATQFDQCWALEEGCAHRGEPKQARPRIRHGHLRPQWHRTAPQPNAIGFLNLMPHQKLVKNRLFYLFSQEEFGWWTFKPSMNRERHSIHEAVAVRKVQGEARYHLGRKQRWWRGGGAGEGARTGKGGGGRKKRTGGTRRGLKRQRQRLPAAAAVGGAAAWPSRGRASYLSLSRGRGCGSLEWLDDGNYNNTHTG